MIYSDYKFHVPAEKQIRLITNTDAKNEADDQFAIVQTLLSPKVDNVGFIAAHYGTRHADAMERSYRELETIFDKMGFDKTGMLYHGAPHAIGKDKQPIDSEGAQLIIREAMKDDPRPLYITFLGPLTDMACALMLEPRIAGRCTVIWIGGGPYPHGGIEFNQDNDIDAVNVVFRSKVPVWQVPKNVYEMMAVSLAELEYRVRPCGEIGEYLCDQLDEHANEPGPRKSDFRTGESWVLGDNPTIGLILYEHRFEFDWVQAPTVLSEGGYVPDVRNRPIRVYRKVDSRLILEDMYAKLALFHQRHGGKYHG
ncbi:MAG: nucleoside hydrolase [Clostridia bacterium]|nr:nucleoside hydrolase [Clostridia bacterium]